MVIITTNPFRADITSVTEDNAEEFATTEVAKAHCATNHGR